MNAAKCLLANEMFRGVSEEHVRLLEGFSSVKTFEIGTRIFNEGDAAKHLYAVGEGCVVLEMSVPSPNGGYLPPTVVDTLLPGEAFGWSVLVEPHVFTLSARTIQPSILVLTDGERLRRALESHKDFGHTVMTNLARLLAGRLAKTREALIYERGWTMVA
jgi:CRP-like cAMP-binding protein